MLKIANLDLVVARGIVFLKHILFLVHLSRRLKCTIVIMCCPSVVVNFSYFRLLLWNCSTEFNETWQKAWSQHPLQSLCFSGRSEKQDGRPGLWFAVTFSTSTLKPLKGIQQNLTGSKISMSSTKFVFFGPIRKTRWPPWSLIRNIATNVASMFTRTCRLSWRHLDCRDVIKICGQLWSQEQPYMTFWASFPQIYRLQQAKQICKLTKQIGLACWNRKI